MGDMVYNTSSDIESHAITYLSQIFANSDLHTANDLANQHIPMLVTEADNLSLTTVPLMEEIKHVVIDLSNEVAPGPDGFPGHFYRHFWPIVQYDIIMSTQYFFTNNYILSNMNSNQIVFIPKIPGADKLENIRPIALANFQFKITTKILVDRHVKVASKIISTQQRG